MENKMHEYPKKGLISENILGMLLGYKCMIAECECSKVNYFIRNVS